MRSLWKDLSRLVDGVSLVAKEMTRHSEALEIAMKGDVKSFVRNTVISATNVSGLTKGKIHEFSPPKASESTIVYFNDNDSPKPLDSVQSIDVVSDHNHSVQSNPKVLEVAETASVAAADDPQGPIKSLVEEDASVIARSEEVSKQNEALSKDRNADVVMKSVKRRRPRERNVPSTPFTRALGFAGLGAGLAWGTVQESTKRLMFGNSSSGDNKQSALSPFLSEQNAERLALALCRMRGAALKIGQMLSIQDESLVPAPILAALEIVRQGADVMPKKQLNQVLSAEFGPDWPSKLSSFNYEPLASASIGQVHQAVTRDGLQVAMKIQYPGVANSIESDIENVRLLLDYTNLIPEGLYLDRAIKVAKEELARECDYEIEAKSQKRFRDMLSGTEGFYVPFVVEELCSKRVLTTELISGIPIDKVASLDQETRNYVGKKLLELTLMELFVFRFMQTDPNWGNFLYNETGKMINLIDFGAARDYPKAFVDDYLRMVLACANRDRDAVIEMSKRLGFLTGDESEIMLDAHVQAGFIVGLPFSKPGGYNFHSTNVTHSVSDLGATMLKHRLTPPPDEAYSLHRKLSGAFLACVKLQAVVPCRELLLDVYESYKFGDEEEILSVDKISVAKAM